MFALGRLWGKVSILSETKHPADEMGRALLRAGGILSSLTNCYDKHEGKFDLGHDFMFEALTNVERMLSDAGESLRALYQNYDLRSLAEIEAAALKAAEIAARSAALQNLGETGGKAQVDFEEAANFEHADGLIDPSISFVDFLQSSEPVLRLSDRLDAILERFPREEPPVKVAGPFDSPSKSYAEFLDKLTAMADAAAVEARRAGKQDVELAPVLESLQADVARLRAVA